MNKIEKTQILIKPLKTSVNPSWFDDEIRYNYTNILGRKNTTTNKYEFWYIPTEVFWQDYQLGKLTDELKHFEVAKILPNNMLGIIKLRDILKNKENKENIKSNDVSTINDLMTFVRGKNHETSCLRSDKDNFVDESCYTHFGYYRD